MREIVIFLILVILALVTASVLDIAQVRAHSWYPIECCSGYDCAPVDKAIAADGEITVTTKHGTARVPRTMIRRDSKDNRMHACIRPNADGVPAVVCVFVPPGI